MLVLKMNRNNTTNRKKQLVGLVMSDKMDKTIVVRVARLVRHPLYKRTVKKFSKFKVHDKKNQAKIGNRVRIEETKPLSKEKRWRLLEIIDKK